MYRLLLVLCVLGQSGCVLWFKDLLRDPPVSDSGTGDTGPTETTSTADTDTGLGAHSPDLVLIPGGTFTMGSPRGEKGRFSNEEPQQVVTLSAFHLMRREVTQGLYEAVMGSNPSKFASCGLDCPVDTVSWFEAVEFANRLSELEGLTPAYLVEGQSVTWVDVDGYRLPTEAEWEFAARAGDSFLYAGSNNVDAVAWHDGNSSGGPQPGCEKDPNGHGLCDMSGNVLEWVWDRSGAYTGAAQRNPRGPLSGESRIARGGSWDNTAALARVAYRGFRPPTDRDARLGFRLARPAAPALVRIPGGTFTMGSPPDQPGRNSDEGPQHEVTLSAFYLMRSEVTQGLYERVMGTNPSEFLSCGLDCPVEQVSWFDAVAFANRLSEEEGLTPAYLIEKKTVTWVDEATGYRLPTEAEWEYAARGGEGFVYAGSDSVDAVAWYVDNSGGSTQAVCQKMPNGYGLCDMSGNVWEWVWDWYGPYTSDAQSNPRGPLADPGAGRVIRGGSFNGNALLARSAYRYCYPPSYRNRNLGFRLVRASAPQSRP